MSLCRHEQSHWIQTVGNTKQTLQTIEQLKQILDFHKTTTNVPYQDIHKCVTELTLRQIRLALLKVPNL